MAYPEARCRGGHPLIYPRTRAAYIPIGLGAQTVATGGRSRGPETGEPQERPPEKSPMPTATRSKGPHHEIECGLMRVDDPPIRLSPSRSSICRTAEGIFRRDAEPHHSNAFPIAETTSHSSGTRRSRIGSPGVGNRSSGPAGVWTDTREHGARSVTSTHAPNANQDTG